MTLLSRINSLFNKNKNNDEMYEGKVVYKTDDNLIETKFLYKRSDEDRTNFIKYVVKMSENGPFYLTKQLLESDMANVFTHRVAWHNFSENKAEKDLTEYLKCHNRELKWNMEKYCYVVKKIKDDLADKLLEEYDEKLQKQN